MNCQLLPTLLLCTFILTRLVSSDQNIFPWAKWQHNVISDLINVQHNQRMLSWCCRPQWNLLYQIRSIFPFQRIEEIMKRTRKGEQSDMKVSSHAFSPHVSTIHTECMLTCSLCLLHREREAMTINRRMRTMEWTRWTLKPWVSVWRSGHQSAWRFYASLHFWIWYFESEGVSSPLCLFA